MTFDIFNRSAKSNEKDLADLQYSATVEFGKSLEDRHMMSPYHIPMPHRPITDLLLCTDVDDPFKYHSRKMVCKLRDIY